MYVRIKRSKNSPKCSVQIVESRRIDGKVKQRIVKHMGTAMEGKELEELKALAEATRTHLEQAGMLPLYTEEVKASSSPKKRGKDKKKEPDASVKTEEEHREAYAVNLLDIVEEKRIVRGIRDIYGALYDTLGFNNLLANPARNRKSVAILKEIVLARIANPESKRASVVNLEANCGVGIELDQVYRMMDKLGDEQIAKLNALVSAQTKALFKEKIDVLYFDATTLYFESFREDEGKEALKKNGYSKDGKFNQPQIVLALIVTKEGLPLGYKAFGGDTFDGHTLLPALKEIKAHYDLDKVVYVADSGMFNKNNLEELDALESKHVSYIVGARIKNLPQSLKEQILDMNNYKIINDELKVATFDYQGKRLVVSYSESRAKKDAFERQKGIDRLRKRLQKSTAPKAHLSNQGYRKYLQFDDTQCQGKLILDETKIEEDAVWDGLKGVVTNETDLSEKEILERYGNLWQVEESFRITKHDLRIRPIYHWKPQRVKAHLAISFMAYTLVRHLQHRIRLQYKKLSPQKIRTALIGAQESWLLDTKTNRRFALPSSISLDAEKIYRLMGVKWRTKPYLLSEPKGV